MTLSTSVLVFRLVALLGFVLVTFALLQEPVREAETRAATGLLRAAGIDGVEVVSQSTVAVSSVRGSFRAIVSPSCSALASLLALVCLASLAPGYPAGRKLAAGAAAVSAVVVGNLLRIAASLAVGVSAGGSTLVLFHDSIGNVFSFGYTLGGYILMLWVLLPAQPADRVPSFRAAA